MATEQEISPYELLGIIQDVTEQEIKTAYRQRSLKVHPDRNPNNPDAARKFHELNQAYELLLDPLRRLALDAKLRVKKARAERFKDSDAKRKNLLDELEERERAFKKARVDKHQEEATLRRHNERIQEEGRRLREEKEREMRLRFEMENKRAEAFVSDLEDTAPEMDPLDTTVRIRYPLKTYPSLNTPQGVAQFLSRFGPTDESSIVLSANLRQQQKKKADNNNNKPQKMGSALVPFKRIGDAFATVCASENKDMGMDGVKITWVKGDEPAILAWLKKMGKLGGGASQKKNSRHEDGQPSSSSSIPVPPPESKPPSAGGGGANLKKGELPQSRPVSSSMPFSSFPSNLVDPLPTSSTQPIMAGIDYEALTLMRLRQAERERLEREILEQETKEAA